MQLEFGLSDVIWTLLLSAWVVSGIYDWQKDRECARTCTPVVGQCIDSVCHCKTSTGWERK